MAKIFVSGANGFIGQRLTRHLLRAGHEVIGGVRQACALTDGVTMLVTGDLADDAPSLTGVEAVIHTAGLAHSHGRTVAQMQRGNVLAAQNLARATPPKARFLFLSSIIVHGRACAGTLTEASPPAPADDYARSKFEAEQALAAILGERLCVIRPTAVIGPHCPGNIPLLLKALRAGVPLPLASLQNQRSFIDVEDLAALLTALLAPTAPKLVLAAHPTPVSTPALIRALAKGLNSRARLFPFPAAPLKLAARLTGKSTMWQSLSGNLVVAPQAALSFGWLPAQTLTESFVQTAQASAP